MPTPPKSFSATLQKYLNTTTAEVEQIPATRRQELEVIADYIQQQIKTSGLAKLTFICTHNSRRSHLCQVWAQIAAWYWNIPGVETYSGGTETTAFNPRAVAALRRAGLAITPLDPDSQNPRYQIDCGGRMDRGGTSADHPSLDDNGSGHADSHIDCSPMICFSKIFDQSPNPSQNYCAVMTCAEADKACPLVSGCDLRAPLRYEDPKVADDTPQESEAYDARSRQICREMIYLMSRAANDSKNLSPARAV